MLIYLLTNLVNGKRYVGLTSQTINARLDEHIASSKQLNPIQTIHKAIQKYGIENFTIETLDTAQTYEELKEKERQWIQKLGTFSDEYNMTRGGEGRFGCVNSEQTRKRISESVTKRFKDPKIRSHLSETTRKYFQNNPQAREHLRQINLNRGPATQEVCEKISKALKGKPKHSNFGKKVSDGWKKRKELGLKKAPVTDEYRAHCRDKMKIKNPMQSAEARAKVSQSKIGKKRFNRPDGSYYMAFPEQVKTT